MQKITTHLWFDNQAREAAKFYETVFNGPVDAERGKSEIKGTVTLDGTPSGSVDIVTVILRGQHFTLLSAGPLFKFNPSVSFLVACETPEDVDTVWGGLKEGGKALMEIGAYPFSGRYGWIEDKYGVSWQVMHMGERQIGQRIVPTMMFAGARAGKAEEAINFYVSVFRDAKVGHVMRYGAGEEPDKEGAVRHAGFTLEGQEFAAMDSARAHDAPFNEAVSFMVHCATQEEVDYYWEKLSAHPEAEQCGWLKDKFGFSWQVVPAAMEQMLAGGDKERILRVTAAFLKMKKFDIAKLTEAYEGK